MNEPQEKRSEVILIDTALSIRKVPSGEDHLA